MSRANRHNSKIVSGKGRHLIPIRGAELVNCVSSTPPPTQTTDITSVGEDFLKRREGYNYPAREIVPVQANN